LHPAAVLAREIAAWVGKLLARRAPREPTPQAATAEEKKALGLVPPNRTF
jgi:hypothetical protein